MLFHLRCCSDELLMAVASNSVVHRRRSNLFVSQSQQRVSNEVRDIASPGRKRSMIPPGHISSLSGDHSAQHRNHKGISLTNINGPDRKRRHRWPSSVASHKFLNAAFFFVLSNYYHCFVWAFFFSFLFKSKFAGGLFRLLLKKKIFLNGDLVISMGWPWTEFPLGRL